MDRFAPHQIALRGNVDDFDTAEYLWSRSDTIVSEQYQRMRENARKNQHDRSNAAIRKRYQGYYAAIEALDDCMGLLLDTLEQAGKLDDTIVVFTSDHGDCLGSHRQDAKQMPFEESISVPMMIRYPESVPAGSVADDLFAPVDIMPTILSLANLPCHQVDGMDLSEAVMGRDSGLQDAVLIQKCIALSTNWITNGNGPWNGVRTKRYTYARLANDQFPWLLYDNVADPLQLTNLANDPAHAALRDRLDQLTSDLLAAAGESGDPAEYARIIHEERNARGLPDRWPLLNPDRVL
jgi:arylsulfatase A-like enzyme